MLENTLKKLTNPLCFFKLSTRGTIYSVCVSVCVLKLSFVLYVIKGLKFKTNLRGFQAYKLSHKTALVQMLIKSSLF